MSVPLRFNQTNVWKYGLIGQDCGRLFALPVAILLVHLYG
jgi:hypothetical protein